MLYQTGVFINTILMLYQTGVFYKYYINVISPDWKTGVFLLTYAICCSMLGIAGVYVHYFVYLFNFLSGITLATALVNSGLISFQAIADKNPRDLEIVCIM